MIGYHACWFSRPRPLSPACQSVDLYLPVVDNSLQRREQYDDTSLCYGSIDFSRQLTAAVLWAIAESLASASEYSFTPFSTEH